MAAPNSLRTLIALRRHASASRDEIAAFRASQLRMLVAHAYARVPYYRRLFDEHGLVPSDIRGPGDLQHVPVTTRGKLQGLGASELVASGIDPARLMSARTAGSTGQPLVIRKSWIETRLLATIRIRALRSVGLRRNDRVAVVGVLERPHAPDPSRAGRLLGTLRPSRWLRVDCALEPDEIVEGIAACGATALAGHPGHLARVAAEAAASRVRALGIRLVLPGGEVLRPDQREIIASAYDAPVYDSYGSREFDLMASECPSRHGYHVCDDGLVLDVVRDGRPAEPGERGEVVGTCLHSFAMPFIRYSLGDLVERGPESCGCGSPFSTIREIQGRVVDFFQLPDGSKLHPYDVFVPIRLRSDWMRQFQVEQLAVDHVVMRVVPDRQPTAEALQLVRRLACERLGGSVRFEIELVEAFETEPGRKFQTYRTRVGSGADSEARTATSLSS